MHAVKLQQPFIGVYERLPFTRVQYESIGGAGKPVIVVLGGISAGAHVAAHDADPSPGWWNDQVGNGRAIDTDDFTVVGYDYLGAELRRGERVPLVDTRDQARALAAILDHLGLAQIEYLVGSSYGGMVALAFAALFPERVNQLIVIGAAHQPHPMATAIRSVQRKIVLQAAARGQADAGLALARQLAMTTYRTPEEFAERFANEHEVDAYLEHCGQRYVETFSPERFLCLSQSIDLHCIDPKQIRVPTTLVAIQGDTIAPPWQIHALAGQLTEATVIDLPSIYGHDAFLKEATAISNILQQTIGVEVHS